MAGGIHTYVTLIGMISISDDGEGGIDGVYLPNSNLPAREDRENGILAEAAGQMDEYLSGKRRVFDLPLSTGGTGFQAEVWDAVSKIPYGSTSTYSDIAEMIGRSSSYRAVGTACRLNPVPIIVPCHRVVRADSDMGGYAGGSNMKRTLISLERGSI